jgi:hypothetical protein
VTFELGEATKDGQHQPAVGSCGVGPSVGQRLEPCTSLADCIEGIEQFSRASRQSVELGNDQSVAWRTMFPEPYTVSSISFKMAADEKRA